MQRRSNMWVTGEPITFASPKDDWCSIPPKIDRLCIFGRRCRPRLGRAEDGQVRCTHNLITFVIFARDTPDSLPRRTCPTPNPGEGGALSRSHCVLRVEGPDQRGVWGSLCPSPYERLRAPPQAPSCPVPPGKYPRRCPKVSKMSKMLRFHTQGQLSTFASPNHLSLRPKPAQRHQRRSNPTGTGR